MDRYREMLTPSEFNQAVRQTRFTSASIEIGRDYLVNGLTLPDVKKKHGVTPERMRQIVARISGLAAK